MIGIQAASRKAKIVKTKASNLMSRKMTTAEKLMREISAEYTGRTIVELNTELHGTIEKIEYDYTVWNKSEQRDGCWMVLMHYIPVIPAMATKMDTCWLPVYAVRLVD